MDGAGAHFAHRWELAGEALKANQLARQGQRIAGSITLFVDGPRVRQWAHAKWAGHKIPSRRHGPFPLLCRSDGLPVELANGQRVAIVQIPPRSRGPWAPRGRAGWRFRLAAPAINPELLTSQLRINQLGGTATIHPETGEKLIGALYRDAQTGHWHLDLCLMDMEAFGFDLQGEGANAIRESIVRRSGGTWLPPTTDPEEIRLELSQRLGIGRAPRPRPGPASRGRTQRP